MDRTYRMLRDLKRGWGDCRRCPLAETRREIVFFRGVLPCDVMFVGEAPGKTEDLTGDPFVGRAGDLLNHWIKDAEQEFGRPFSYGVTNIVACIPLDAHGKIRQPDKDEAKACSPRLKQTFLAAQPKLVVLLGQVAKKHYKMYEELDIKEVVELQHPAYVLRQGGVGVYAYESNLLKLVRALETHCDEIQRKKSEPSLRQAKVARRAGTTAKGRIAQGGARKPIA